MNFNWDLGATRATGHYYQSTNESLRLANQVKNTIATAILWAFIES